MDGQNNKSEGQFLKEIGHPRKKELAKMLLEGASVEAMNAAGFGRINILEMASSIRRNVEGREEFSIEIPRGTGMDSSSPEEVAASEAAAANEKKTSPANSQQSVSSPASATGQTAENNDAGNESGSVDQKAPDGQVVPGTTPNEPTLNPTETLGGNPVGTLTGQEDAEALQRKADEAAGNPVAPQAPQV